MRTKLGVASLRPAGHFARAPGHFAPRPPSSFSEIRREDHIPFAPVRTIDEVVNDQHLKVRDFFVDIDHPAAGKLKYPGFPYKLTATPCRIERPAPLLGQHNEAILCGRLGYSGEQLAALRQTGIV